MNVAPLKLLRALGLIVVVSVAPAAVVQASPTSSGYNYETIGNVGTPWAPVGTVWFNDTQPTALIAPGTISLGQFETNPLPPGASLTFQNMPFYVDVMIYKGPVPSSAVELQVNGMLNGTLTGSTGSTLTATLSSVQQLWGSPLPFSLSNFHVELPQLVAPSGVNGGTTGLYAYISQPLNTPEPTSCAVFALTAGAGLCWIRRRGR